jgi:hypothetical protein
VQALAVGIICPDCVNAMGDVLLTLLSWVFALGLLVALIGDVFR